MAAGYAFGPVMLQGLKERQRMVLGLGAMLTAVFVLLRVENAYGDRSPGLNRVASSLRYHPF